MMFPPYGVAASAFSNAPQTADLFDLDFRNAVVDFAAGTLTLPSGHVGVWSRATPQSSVVDFTGATYTALDGQMGWENRDWDNDGIAESFGLRMSTADRLAFLCNLRSNIAVSGLLEFVETGCCVGTAGGTLLALTKDDGSGDGWWIDTSGTASGFYGFNYRVGGTTRTARIASGRPASGERVQLFWDLTQPGVVSLSQTINGATATTASASALAQPSAWGSPCSIRVNARGTSANPGQAFYRRIRHVAGALNQSTIAERR